MSEKKKRVGDSNPKKRRGSARKEAKPKDPEKVFQKALDKWVDETVDIVFECAGQEIHVKGEFLMPATDPDEFAHLDVEDSIRVLSLRLWFRVAYS